MKRRTFLIRAIGTITGLLGHPALLRSARAAWPAERFANGEFNARFHNEFGDSSILDSNKILLNLPSIAENGAVVPIHISSDLDNVDKLQIWVEKNPTPLAAEFDLTPTVLVYLTARIKMAESSHVIVMARQGNQWLRARQWVQVMVGGCGTG